MLSKSKSNTGVPDVNIMKNIRMRSDWLRVALLLSEISPSIGLFGVVCKINKIHSITNIYS